MTPGSVVVGFLDDGQWSACFGMSYRDMWLNDITGSQRIFSSGTGELRLLCGTGGIPQGRNAVAKDFLDHTKGEWLFFIDTDMGFTSDTVDRLVKSADATERPVMGGLCFALKRGKRGEAYLSLRAERFRIQPTVYEYLELTEPKEVGFRPLLDYKRDDVIQVAGTGAACLLIHRSALEKVREKYGDAWFDQIVHPTGDRGKPRTFSEDLSFCVRLQACGIPVHVDTAVKTTHEKGGIFLDEEMYDAQRRDEAREKANQAPAEAAAA